jgi:poly-gamma-glutamate synthesis protein (capsule biosynthesis protein)
MAAGDNLIHDVIYRQAQARAKGAAPYDFDYAYDGVRALLAKADLAYINQETPVAGAIAPPSSYPRFNSPTELGDAVVKLGFRAIGLSNNHMLDKGAQGVLASLDYWAMQPGNWQPRPQKVVTIGAYRDMADFAAPRVLEVNGIRFAFVAATDGYNGLALPNGSPLVLPLLHDEDLLRQAIAAGRKVADVVTACFHWGDENSPNVNDAQRELAQKAADWGADIILGSHPHVLQPMESIDKADGGKAFVIYSLGNFISAQNKAPNLVGGVLELTIEKIGDVSEVKAPVFHPVVTQYGSGYSNLHLVAWSDYTPALAQAHGVRSHDSRFSYDYIKELLERTGLL